QLQLHSQDVLGYRAVRCGLLGKWRQQPCCVDRLDHRGVVSWGMSYWVIVSPQEDFQGTSPPGMLPFLIRVSNTKEHDQAACMGMFAPSDILPSLAFRPKHAHRVASFIALQAVRN